MTSPLHIRLEIQILGIFECYSKNHWRNLENLIREVNSYICSNSKTAYRHALKCYNLHFFQKNLMCSNNVFAIQIKDSHKTASSAEGSRSSCVSPLFQDQTT